MSNNIVEVIVVPKREFKSLILSSIEEALNARRIHGHLGEASGSDKLLRREDVAKLFKVSLPTIHSWMNSGILPFHRIGSRTFFKYSEVMDAMKSIRIRRRVGAGLR